MTKNKFIVITGPTASGKTKVSVEVARALNSQIISADSMQIYKGMDIGTAKVTEAEMQHIPHHLIDIVLPDHNYSVAEFQRHAFQLINKINQTGTVPIVAGGTGLYIHSLVYKLDFSNSKKNESLRQKYIQLADDKSIQYLYNILKAKDPNYANIISPNDKKRIIRRLEIIETSGVQDYNLCQHNNDYDFIIIGLNMPREMLYKRVNERVDEMLKNGLVDEAYNLYNKYENVNALKAIGYKELIGYFDKQYDLEEAVRLIKRNTRRFVKRQITWFKRDNRIVWFDISGYTCIEHTINDIIGCIKGKGF